MFAVCRILSLCALLVLVAPARASAWNPEEFTVGAGDRVASAENLTVAADARGQALLSVPLAGQIVLDDQYRLVLDLAGKPPLAAFLLWRSDADADASRLHRYPLPLQSDRATVVDMRGQPGWQGRLRLLQLLFILPPGQQVSLRRLSLSSPGPLEVLGDLWRSWAVSRSWRAIDINLNTGLSGPDQGLHPLPVFAGLSLILWSLYFLWRRRKATFRCAGLILLCVWIALDGFWQFRLWRQVSLTRERFAGKSTAAKLLASEDAPFAYLARQTRRRIGNPRARVFIASAKDSYSMRAAYYLSPFNTFWHRRGPELPPGRYLHPGDFILLLPPSRLRYDQQAQRLLEPRGDSVAVLERYANPVGLLLEVR